MPELAHFPSAKSVLTAPLPLVFWHGHAMKGIVQVRKTLRKFVLPWIVEWTALKCNLSWECRIWVVPRHVSVHGCCLEGGGKQGQKQSQGSVTGIASRFGEQFRMAMRSERSIKMFAKRVTSKFGAIARAGIAALMLVAGIGLVTAPALAQDKAPAKKGQKAGEKGKNFYELPWVKLCPKLPSRKDPKKAVEICNTSYEVVLANGIVLLDVTLREIKGKKPMISVMVPLGAVLRPGAYLKFDKAKEIKIPYTICASIGCYAEIEASPEILKQMKSAKQMAVAFMSADGKVHPMGVPMDGFTEALNGKPGDMKKDMAKRKGIYMEIRQRQVEAYKKAKAAAEAKKNAGKK
jgi:invasion protein IalB